MKKIFIIMGILLFIGLIPVSFGAAPASGHSIQMAILLDTSNSMDGLISQAKTELWKIVNEMARTRKDGQAPHLEVALFEYGKSSIPAGEGYLRMSAPLTTDLDKISEELFKLTTNGGDEYCGQVIQSAVNNLKWSADNHDLKIIVIAGNEPFTQGSVDYQKSCRTAAAHGITVNTIFCGNRDEGIQGKWKDGADLADGFYLNIDQNQQVINIQAPQDAELVKLGQQLNTTYIPYGPQGDTKMKLQSKQDANAAGISSEAAVQRSVAKAAPVYSNSVWDLVDAVKSNGFEWLDKLPANQLPVEMQKMTPAERRQFITAKIAERDKIQNRINQLNKDRQTYVANEMKKHANQSTFGTALVGAIQQQAAKKGFAVK